MYAFEICAEGIFVTFPWWLENVKNRSEIALFSNYRHFEIWFPKKRTITFLWGKLSKLHNKHDKDRILHVATIFSLKQGETRTSHGPIPRPLNQYQSPYLNPYIKMIKHTHTHTPTPNTHPHTTHTHPPPHTHTPVIVSKRGQSIWIRQPRTPGFWHTTIQPWTLCDFSVPNRGLQPIPPIEVTV